MACGRGEEPQNLAWTFLPFTSALKIRYRDEEREPVLFRILPNLLP